MKIYAFKFDNYYSGSRNFKVLANSEAEALAILIKERSKYMNDEETTYVGRKEIELDSPKIIGDF